MASRPVILIVDDDGGSTALCAETFTQAGYVVITAPDGDRGLKLALERRPDVVVTDLYLPYLSGAELIGALRAAGEQVPVVLMSGSVDGKITAFQCHADAFIEKPFEVREALNIVENLLAKGTNPG
jgi:two-component system alkaline phosphatase synthesis response regulator PhoP